MWQDRRDNSSGRMRIQIGDWQLQILDYDSSFIKCKGCEF